MAAEVAVSNTFPIDVDMKDNVEDNDDDDVFVRPWKRTKIQGQRRPIQKRIQIVLTTTSATANAANKDNECDEEPKTNQSPSNDTEIVINKPSSPSQAERPDDNDGLLDVATELNDLEEIDEELEQELEDSLNFFQETHEEQDPAYALYQKKIAEEERQKKLAALDKEDKSGRIDIENVIAQQLKEKQDATEYSLSKYKQRAADEEKANSQRLDQLYHQKVSSNMNKINEGIEILHRRHKRELQAAVQQHRLQAQQRRLTEQQMAAEWQTLNQQIQSKQHRQIEAFRAKGEELKQKTESDYKNEQAKIRQQYLTKMQEIESSRQKLLTKLSMQFQQLRQRYLKRHLQRIMKEKEELLNQGPIVSMTSTDSMGTAAAVSPMSSSGGVKLQTATNPRELARSTLEERSELNPPSPIKSIEPWARELKVVSGAALRHKHRKGVMGQTTRQLSIEIHNEGLWLSSVYPPSESDNNAGSNKAFAERNDHEFIAWGAKSHEMLEAVVCGEIPTGVERFLERHPNASDILAAQGGQVRCVLTDLRTGDRTASVQRAACVKELEEETLKSLEVKADESNRMFMDAEKAAKEATAKEKEQENYVAAAAKELEKAKRIQEEFRNKFKHFLGPDDNPAPDMSEKDRQDLQNTILRYKNNLEVAVRNEKGAKQALAETRTKIKKLQDIVKVAQRNYGIASSVLRKKRAAIQASEKLGHGPNKQDLAALADNASNRVAEVIGALQKTAAKRRHEADQKKNTNVSSAWIQSFPGISTALKKSVWHRMHRRKQQIILRPCEENLVNELRSNVATLASQKYINMRSSREKIDLMEEEMNKAEASFLLALHPLKEADLPAIPPSKTSDNWAEPGWMLCLDVPDESSDIDFILPRSKSVPVLERNLSEIASAPGRQAASLLRTSHLRCLEAPLSLFAVASSPAETSSTLASIHDMVDGDPLHVTEASLTAGYSFTHTPSSPRSTAQSRKKVSTSKSSADINITSQPQVHPPSHSKATERKKSEPKKRRPSTDNTNKAPTASPSPRSQGPVATSPNPAAISAPYSQYMQQQVQQQQQAQAQQHLQHAQQAQMKHQLQAQQQHYPPQPQQQPVTDQQPRQPPQQMQGYPQQFFHQQQYSNSQMAQLRMMQQQQQQQQAGSPRHQQMHRNYPPQALQQMQQFYAPLTHPNAMAHMQMHQSRPIVPQQQQPPPPPPSQQQQHHHHQMQSNSQQGQQQQRSGPNE